MCGIAGIINSKKPIDVLSHCAEKMIAALSHRGPDSNGIWINDIEDLLFIHARLAIQDLSEYGKQPMFSSSGRYCVVFNGEIYNFVELSIELSGLGHAFTGHSDTEVLLAAIEEWGVDGALEKLSGMFAFSIWDHEKRTLHLCRDRMGEKPLYYGWVGESFYFASELKAIETVVTRKYLEINPDALAEYLQYGYIGAPYSIYKGIYKLPPGTILTLRHDQICHHSDVSVWPDVSGASPKSYWRVRDVVRQGMEYPVDNEHEAIEILDGMLHRVVRRQLVADVGVGLFLSGGIDSTVVSAIAQAESVNKIRTFTIGFEEKEYDESLYAEKIAQHLGTEHHTLNLNSYDALDAVPSMATIYDEPFADSSQIPSFLVSKMARKHVTVCLSGDGGDELFAGYNRYLWQHGVLARLFGLPVPVRKQMGKILSIPSPGFWDALYKKVATKSGAPYGAQKLIGLKIQKMAGLLRQDGQEQAYDYLLSYWHSPRDVLAVDYHARPRGDNNQINSLDFIDQAMYLDQTGYLPGDNLVKVDRASMAVGLETRLPLLSHELVELSWRFPNAMKYKDNTSKWVLRQVLYKYVPQHLIDRPKMGFSVPVARWLRNDLREWAGDLLANVESRSNGLLKEQPVRKIWGEHLSGKMDHSHRLWAVLMFLSWVDARI